MGCKVAENRPLQYLRSAIGLPFQCHSLREHCQQGAERRLENATMGGAGAAIGYCQALFNRAGSPDVHTEAVLKALKAIGAPWSRSHELFWGYRRNESAAQFLSKALQPLTGTGRVPVVISGLDPATDSIVIQEIVSTSPSIVPGESVLLRLVLKSQESIDGTVEIIKSLVTNAYASGEMPKWWPLLQASFDSAQWNRLRLAMGEYWRYVNVAVNPFVPAETISELAPQITVAQFVVGLSDGIHSNGDIALPNGMKIHGAVDGAAYNIFRYARTLRELRTMPTCILLGPSSENWTVAENIARLHRFLGLFKDATEILWDSIGSNNRQEVWSMAA